MKPSATETKTATAAFEARRHRVGFWLLIGGIILLVIATDVVLVAIDWCWKRKIAPYGGRYFFHRVELAVPPFFQNDPAWGDDPLGPTENLLGNEGCAVTSLAMLFRFYGIDTDPHRLNQFLTAHDGFTGRGWLCWDRAPALAPDRVRHVYEDLPSYWLIDQNLARGNPVIVRLRLRSGVTHFVVIVGKSGFDYLIRDPGAGGRKGVYPLRELGSNIEALRFYQKL